MTDVILCVLMFALGFSIGIWCMKHEFHHMEMMVRDAEAERKRAEDLLEFEIARFMSPGKK
mgnify:CR=1 FL=1